MTRFDLAGSGLADDRGFIAARAELRSLIAAPLIAAGTALGVLVVFRDVTEEPYDETDLQLCTDLAERAAQAIYNARLMADVVRADAELASRILTRSGYKVCMAPTASQAPSIAGDTGQPIDLLLTDVVMPEMLGDEVARRVHALRPALPVL